jgi:hypothetical protein
MTTRSLLIRYDPDTVVDDAENYDLASQLEQMFEHAEVRAAVLDVNDAMSAHIVNLTTSNEELLAALERLTIVCEGAGWLRNPNDAISQARSAIAKAKEPS